MDGYSRRCVFIYILLLLLISWVFNSKLKKNGFFLRYSNFDIKVDKDLSLVFEFIVYIERNKTLFELSCCYGEIPLLYLSK